LAEYKVVEVTQLDLRAADEGHEADENNLNEFCPEGWEIVSARFLAGRDAQKALMLLSR